MQKVRIYYKGGAEEEMSGRSVQVLFASEVVKVWRGRYWQEIPFNSLAFVSTWEEDEK